MKKLIATLAAFSILSAGCVLVPKPPSNGGDGSTNNTNNAQFIYVDESGLLVIAGMVVDPGLVGLTVGTGVSFELAKVAQSDTNSISYMVAVKSVIDASLTNSVYDPVALRAALDSISIKEIRSNNSVKSVITMALDNYSKYYSAIVGQRVDNVSPYLRPILQGISDGIGNVTRPKLLPKGKLQPKAKKITINP